MNIEYSLEGAYMARNGLRLIRPFDFVGGAKVRLGRPFDGGYVMIDDFEGIEAAYSLGINDDVSWDFDVVQRGIDVYQYDHTIQDLPYNHKKFHWRKIGISHFSDGEMKSIPDLVVENGHVSARNLLLKCDIECAEWEVLYNIPSETMSQFRQIVIEVHNLSWLGNVNHADVARQALVNLTRHHNVIHVHANNYGGFGMVGGLMIPNVIELTLLRKDRGDFVPSSLIFPTELDMPCNREWADIYLGSFVFP